MSYLETLVTRFYEKHDASKLGDVNHVSGIVTWTKNNGIEALEGKLKAKYKEGLADLVKPDDPPIESDWNNVEKALEKFYAKHEPNKSEEQIREIFKWTIQKGVFALNEKLIKKYGEGLPKVCAIALMCANFLDLTNIPICLTESLGNLEITLGSRSRGLQIPKLW